MNAAIKIAGSVFLILFVTVVLRELGFKGARLVALLGAICVFTVGASLFENAWEMIDGISGIENAGEYVSVAMKIVGIGYISGICSDACLEFGELSLSNSVLMLGRMEMLVLCLPYAVSIIERGVTLL